TLQALRHAATQPEATIVGTKVIGAARLTRVPAGSARAMMDNGSTTVTGKASTAVSSTITNGITTMTAITVAITITMTTVTAMATTTTTMTATKIQRSLP